MVSLQHLQDPTCSPVITGGVKARKKVWAHRSQLVGAGFDLLDQRTSLARCSLRETIQQRGARVGVLYIWRQV